MLVQYKEEIQRHPILLIQPLKRAIQANWVSKTIWATGQNYICKNNMHVAENDVGYVDAQHLEANEAQTLNSLNTRLFISPSGISELDCATTKTDTAERSISIGRESLQVFLY